MLTQFKPITQVSTTEKQTGIINPTRSIIAEDEVYLRDYELAAAVISWEQGFYATPAAYKAEDITNIGFKEDMVWYQLGINRSYPLHIETFHTLRREIEKENKKVIAPDQTPKISLTPENLQYEWKVTYDSMWDWYWVWVEDRAIARASTHEQAEQLAQEYIAEVEFWSSHREQVLVTQAA